MDDNFIDSEGSNQIKSTENNHSLIKPIGKDVIHRICSGQV